MADSTQSLSPGGSSWEQVPQSYDPLRFIEPCIDSEQVAQLYCEILDSSLLEWDCWQHWLRALPFSPKHRLLLPTARAQSGNTAGVRLPSSGYIRKCTFKSCCLHLKVVNEFPREFLLQLQVQRHEKGLQVNPEVPPRLPAKKSLPRFHQTLLFLGPGASSSDSSAPSDLHNTPPFCFSRTVKLSPLVIRLSHLLSRPPPGQSATAVSPSPPSPPITSCCPEAAEPNLA